MSADLTAAFLKELARYGLNPGVIKWDGDVHRFPGAGKGKGNTAGWYRAFTDQRGAVFGDFSAGLDQVSWQHRNGQRPDDFDPVEWKKTQDEMAERDEQREIERQAAQEMAAEDARARWEAAEQVNLQHPYLIEKGLKSAPGLRQEGEILLAAMKDCDDGSPIINVQRIFRDGKKRYQKGARKQCTRLTMGASAFRKTRTLYLAEGWATAATIHEVTGACVVVCFDAGNMREVAAWHRAEYPDAKITVASDNDRWTTIKRDGADIPNPGLVFAREAAAACGGEVAIPDFKPEHLAELDEDGKGPTDFNDLNRLEGAETVRYWLDPARAKEATTTVATPAPAPSEPAEPSVPSEPAQPSPTSEPAQAELSGSQMGRETEPASEADIPEEKLPAVVSSDPKPDGELEVGRTAVVTLEDFWAYMVEHKYVFEATRELWPAVSVNARVPKQGDVKASTWLDTHRAVEQMTWAPGYPLIIEDRLIDGGGWIERPGCRVFNLYRAPTIELGDPTLAARWVKHTHRVYPSEAEHLIKWLAHRVQRPHEKVNHAIVLIGPQGAGKDTIVQGVVPAVGPWNVWEVDPKAIMGRFHPWKKSVILRISEARDLGDTDRYGLYEHTKTLIAAPPDVLTVDEKNKGEYMVPNVLGVVITSNHTDGIYLPPDDRRHFVALTELTKDDFTASYWTGLYGWYERGGHRHIAAYLTELDLSDFDPKAPPPKTSGFWTVVDAGRAPEDAELADVIEGLGQPDAVTLSMLAARTDGAFADWLQNRKNSRNIPHRMHHAGYVAVMNEAATDGLWKVARKRQRIYARQELSVGARLEAATRLVESERR